MARKRLSEENKKEIRELFKQGYTQPGLAAIYEVSERTIYRVLNPEAYKKDLAFSMKYQRENSEKVRANRAVARRDYKLSFSYKHDNDVIEHLDKQDNINSYIRDLITDDMKKPEQKKE